MKVAGSSPAVGIMLLAQEFMPELWFLVFFAGLLLNPIAICLYVFFAVLYILGKLHDKNKKS